MANLAIVTGATGGLGGEYAKDLAKRGYNLIITGTNQTRVEGLKDELEKMYKEIQVYAKACDLSSEISRAEFFNFLKEKNLKPNTLINNAGYILEGSFLGCDEIEITKAVEVNAVGTLDLTYNFLKQRDENERCYILTVSSLAGFYPIPQMAVYGATKSLLTNFSVALRRELRGKKVNVTAVCPGSIATNEAMKASIKSQGIGGQLSLLPTATIAHRSINKMLKNKAKYVPGFFNKMMWLLTRFVSQTFVANFLYKRWTKCEKKRGAYR